jgi:hypothetical protein
MVVRPLSASFEICPMRGSAFWSTATSAYQIGLICSLTVRSLIGDAVESGASMRELEPSSFNLRALNLVQAATLKATFHKCLRAVTGRVPC